MGSRRHPARAICELGWLRPEDRALRHPLRRSSGRAGRTPTAARGRPGAPLRFGVIGSILPHKGIHVAVAAFRGVDPARADAPGLGGPGGLPRLRGGARGARLAGGHASRAVRGGAAGGDLRRARRADRPLAGARVVRPGGPRGAGRGGAGARRPPRRARRAVRRAAAGAPCGALFDPEDPEELRGWIERLVGGPGIVAAWAAAPPRVKEMDEHAEEIEEVYERILAARAQTAA